MKRKLASKCAGCPYRGRHIYIVGPARFERELMTDFIGAHTAAKCLQAESLEDVPVSIQGVPLGQKMIMIDTHSFERDNLFSLLQSNIWETHSHNLIALFDVPHDYAIEKEALRSGVRGILYDDDSTEDLINGICSINSGELWIHRNIISECLQESFIGNKRPPPKDHFLSNREVQLLRVLTTGGSNDMIADQLCISPHTVKTHLHNIFHKIEVSNRLQAVIWAKENL
jgi:DNA-binding NarL/FixJ family response regulator